jgi:predicted glycosyltransferase
MAFLPIVLVWADIENQPQVQYLLPVVDACRRRGARTVITARDDGGTLALLESRGEIFWAVGESYGATKSAKLRGLLARSRALGAVIRREGVPGCLVCASRAAALVARRHGVPSYMISDYEHANLTIFRLARSTILHPDVIESTAYLEAGFPRDRVIGFRGLKEDLTFAGVDLDTIEPFALEHTDRDLVRVLVRPPAEESHYYSSDSRRLYLETLEYLAREKRALIVLAPRYRRQAADLGAFSFENTPIVLDQPVSFVSLLKAVDLVLCSGGTMLREAAYLGIPAYSIFRSRLGEVDNYLQSIGRALLLSSPEELDRIELKKAGALSPLATNANLVDEIAEIVMSSRRTRAS